MERRALGRSGLAVPKICLGTMTWGEQNSEQDGFAQMDFALDRGVDFFDTAEMYPIAPRAETYGRTEEIVGKWLRARGTRDKIVLATKVTGPDTRFPYMRDGKPRLNRKHIVAAIDGSLKRLQTDYVDLYQLHWPDRTTNAFGQLGYEQLEEDTVPLEESLAALAELVTAGKVRHIGVSNETPWGLMRYLTLGDAGHGPRVVSIQNPYSLLNRSFDVGLAEVALREGCGLLAYAPVAAGALTGKYLNGARPPGARMTLFPNNRRYLGPAAEAATADYVALAREAGLDPARMALAFVMSRPFVTSAIVGATSIPQLENALVAADAKLSADILEELEALGRKHIYPCP